MFLDTLDDEVAWGLAQLPPVMDPAEGLAGLAADSDSRIVAPVPHPRLDILDTTIPGLAGNPDVPVRRYLPPDGGQRPRRGVMFIHGGGFVGGSAAEADLPLQRIADVLETVVVAPTYRLAPDHPFPAAFEDCRAAWRWLVDTTDHTDVDPGRLVLFGGSAGGAIAAGMALHGRDHGWDGPAPAQLMLAFPMLDDRDDHPSRTEVSDHRMLNGQLVTQSWEAYLDAAPSPYAVPARADDLAGLPPTWVMADQVDPLRDEAIAFAQRLMQAGVRTELHTFPGTFHGSSGLVPDAEVSKRQLQAMVDTIARV